MSCRILFLGVGSVLALPIASFAQTCVTVADCADVNGDGARDDACTFYACEAGVCVETPRVTQADVGSNGCALDGACIGTDAFQVLNCFNNVNTMGTSPYPCEDNPAIAMNVGCSRIRGKLRARRVL